MPDIAITWVQTDGRGVWLMNGPDLLTGSDLQTSILVGLFTDRVAPPDYVTPAPTTNTDRRGWWGDTYSGTQLGSLLWTLARAAKTKGTLVLIEKYAADALQPLIDAGVVAYFDITAIWINRTNVGLHITAHKPTGNPETFLFGWAWGQIG